MLVPRFVHGLTRDVKKESLRRIRLMKKGARWSEAMEDELVDVATLPGLVVVNGPGVLMGFDPHTHIYSPSSGVGEHAWTGTTAGTPTTRDTRTRSTRSFSMRYERLGACSG